MKIAQISDIHISADARLVDGIDPREHFAWSLAEATRSGCDLIVLSGDLATTKHDWGAYPWIARQVDALPMPTLVMPGNHDSTSEIVRCFGLDEDVHEGTLRHRRAFDEATVYCLDTSSAQLSADQLDWVHHHQHAAEATTPLLFLHHPPILCNCRFMDSHYPLENREPTWQRLRTLDDVHHIFCGHYHTYKDLERDDIHVVLCPSTLLQIDQHTPGFAIEHKHPGYLEITVQHGTVTWQPIYRER